MNKVFTTVNEGTNEIYVFIFIFGNSRTFTFILQQDQYSTLKLHSFLNGGYIDFSVLYKTCFLSIFPLFQTVFCVKDRKLRIHER